MVGNPILFQVHLDETLTKTVPGSLLLPRPGQEHKESKTKCGILLLFYDSGGLVTYNVRTPKVKRV